MADFSLGMLFTAHGPADANVFARYEVLNKLLASRPGLPPTELLQLAVDAVNRSLRQAPIMRAPLSHGRELVMPDLALSRRVVTLLFLNRDQEAARDIERWEQLRPGGTVRDRLIKAVKDMRQRLPELVRLGVEKFPEG